MPYIPFASVRHAHADEPGTADARGNMAAKKKNQIPKISRRSGAAKRGWETRSARQIPKISSPPTTQLAQAVLSYLHFLQVENNPSLSTLNQEERAKAATQLAQVERVGRGAGSVWGRALREASSVFPTQWTPNDDKKIDALISAMFEAGKDNWYPDVDMRMLHLVDALFTRLRAIEKRLAKLNPALLGAE